MPHHGEPLIAISKRTGPDGTDQFAISAHYDGVDPWDVFRGAVALVAMIANHLRVTTDQVLDDMEQFIADGAVGQIREEPRRDN